MYLPSDPRLEWPGERPLFELNLNKCWGENVGTIRVTLNYVRPGPLARQGTLGFTFISFVFLGDKGVSSGVLV